MSLLELFFGAKKRRDPRRLEDLNDYDLLMAEMNPFASYQQQQAAERERERRLEAAADAHKRRQEKKEKEEWVRDRLLMSNLESLADIGKTRESYALQAKIFGELFDELASGIIDPTFSPMDVLSRLKALKETATETLTALGEARYKATVRDLGMSYIESHPGRTAEQVMALIEGAILDKLVGHNI